MATVSRESVREILHEFLAGKGLRKTAQREAIIEAAFGTNKHYTAEELLEMSRSIDRSVSRATVYRTLPLLVASGLLRELDLGGDTKIYDPNFLEHPTHNHLVCVDCKKIIEFEDPNMELLENCIKDFLVGTKNTVRTEPANERCNLTTVVINGRMRRKGRFDP